MVVFKELVLKCWIGGIEMLSLMVMCGDIAYLIKIFRANLTDMHVYHKAVVSINLKQFLFGETLSLHKVANVYLFMRQNNLRMSCVITRSFYVDNFKVSVYLVLINTEVEIFLSGHFVVSCSSNASLLFLRDLILESQMCKLFLNNFVDLSSNCIKMGMITLDLLQLTEDTLFGATVFQVLSVFSLSSNLLILLSLFVSSNLPQSLKASHMRIEFLLRFLC